MAIVLNAKDRSELGSTATKQVRAVDAVPGIMYSKEIENLAISVSHKDIDKALESEEFATQPFKIKLENDEHDVVLKAVQRHPYKRQILHFDVLKITEDSIITTIVPIHFFNEDSAAGVKIGGYLTRNMSEVQINGPAKSMPSHIDVDLKSLGLEQVLHISDLELPKGVSSVALNHGQDLAIAAVHKPKGKAEDVIKSAE